MRLKVIRDRKVDILKKYGRELLPNDRWVSGFVGRFSRFVFHTADAEQSFDTFNSARKVIKMLGNILPN